MDTTILFNFEFVDRYKERVTFSNYTNNNLEKILWITGERGIGKTRFVKEMIHDISRYKFIWIDNEVQNENDSVVSQLLNELQQISGETFYDFLKSNYKLLLESGKEIIKTFLSEKSYFLEHIANFLFNATSKYSTKSHESNEIYQSFISYIDKISVKYPIFIILDNFSRYTKTDLDVFLNLIRNYIRSESTKFCIITTDEDMEINTELQTKIFVNIPFQNISIKKFPSHIFFGEILHKIFGDMIFSHSDIEYIYEKCEGNPENLIKIIKKSWMRNAINVSDSLISINKEILYTILRKETTHFYLNDFNFKEQLLLLVIICFGKTINIELLKLVIDCLATKIFIYKQFSDAIFFETLGQLINDKIITYGIDNMLIFEHDSVYLDICDILFDLKLKPQICKHLYELIITMDFTNYGYSESNCEYYKAYYASEAYIPGWEEINFEYAKSLAIKHLYHTATTIFDKIPTTYFSEKSKKMFFIAYVYYEDGQYQKSYNILNILQIHDNYDILFLYNYYFYLGKVQNILGKKEEAIKNFKKALKKVKLTSPSFVETLNLLHLTYLETSMGREKAGRIFNYIKIRMEYITPLEWAKTMRGAANFCDNNEALILLNRAADIVRNKNNEIELAYIENSIGFIYLRSGEIDNAETHFYLSYEKIKNYKLHEISYALNNRAICLMLNKKYEEALGDFLKALLWNSSPYAYYTINCHLCICYYFLNQKDETRRIVHILEDYIIQSDIFDLVVLRKIKITLGIIYNLMGEKIISDSYFSNLSDDLIFKTSSEYRYRYYTNQLNGYNGNSNLYYTNVYFEPWILIYGHD